MEGRYDDHGEAFGPNEDSSVTESQAQSPRPYSPSVYCTTQQAPSPYIPESQSSLPNSRPRPVRSASDSLFVPPPYAFGGHGARELVDSLVFVPRAEDSSAQSPPGTEPLTKHSTSLSDPPPSSASKPKSLQKIRDLFFEGKDERNKLQKNRKASLESYLSPVPEEGSLRISGPIPLDASTVTAPTVPLLVTRSSHRASPPRPARPEGPSLFEVDPTAELPENLEDSSELQTARPRHSLDPRLLNSFPPSSLTPASGHAKRIRKSQHLRARRASERRPTSTFAVGFEPAEGSRAPEPLSVQHSSEFQSPLFPPRYSSTFATTLEHPELIRVPSPLRGRKTPAFSPVDLTSRPAITVTPAPSQLIVPVRSSSIQATMDPSAHLDPVAALEAITQHRSEAIRLAREQSDAVTEMCRRSKIDVPQYSFEELIGKGAYGRVYKGHHLPSRDIVAIKVIDIDKFDYDVRRDFKDESIKDFIHETKVMQRAKDSGAKNVNMFIEAFSIHTQLWLVCEYCPGGSVKTLMRATGDKLEEKYIIPIARELAEGLKAIHGAGIIHRDVKAANILIHEEGKLQICDFGVAGILQSQVDKRSTWIGTPHWMPPEMFAARGGEAHQYSSEIDVWAYGCTLFECATGNPPNANLRERIQIGRQLNRFPPKLEGERYSDDLRGLVAYALESDPMTRPSMGDVLRHSYISDSTATHPTESLRELVATYYQWLQRGGQRISLFHPGGAAAAELPDDEALDRDSWNFSTTDGFQKRYSILDFDQLSESLAALEVQTPLDPPQQPIESASPATEPVTTDDIANFDERVRRGAAAFEGLFDETKPSYKYETKSDFVPMEQRQKPRQSDLPLRTETDRSSVTSTLIDLNLGDFDSAHYAAGSATQDPPFQLADADTIRANRTSNRSLRNSTSGGSEQGSDAHTVRQRGPRPPTMEWIFPSMTTAAEGDEAHTGPNEEDQNHDDIDLPYGGGDDKRDTRTWTFPVMTAEDDTADSEGEDRRGSGGSTADMSLPFPFLQPAPLSRNRTAGSGTAVNTSFPEMAEPRPSTSRSGQSAVSDADYDPFKFDRPANTGEMDQFPSLIDAEEYIEGGPVGSNGFSVPGDPGYPSESSSTYPREEEVTTDSASEAERPLQFPEIVPPSMESLTEGASTEEMIAEMDRMLGDFVTGLSVLGEGFARWEEDEEYGV